MADFTSKSGKQFTTFVEDSINQRLRNAMEKVAPQLAEKVKETFDKQGARGDHDKWVVTGNPTPLVDTGSLRDSFEGQVVDEGDDLVIVVSTDKDYAKKHNEGLDGLPKRQFMFFTEDDQHMFHEAMDEEAQ